MQITFENDNDVIIYALEKIISFAKRNQQIFVAQCVWWLASIIGLELGLISFIDDLYNPITNNSEAIGRIVSPETESLIQVHPSRVNQILKARKVSPIPRDLTEDQRLPISKGRVQPLPVTRKQLKQARKLKRRQSKKKN